MHTEQSKAAHHTGQAAKTSDQRKILEALEVGPKTLSQLAAIIGKPNSTVSARLDLLRRWGIVAQYWDGNFHIVPKDFQERVARLYRSRITINRAKTLLSDLEFLPPYLIDACNRFLMDNGEKPKPYIELVPHRCLSCGVFLDKEESILIDEHGVDPYCSQYCAEKGNAAPMPVSSGALVFDRWHNHNGQ